MAHRYRTWRLSLYFLSAYRRRLSLYFLSAGKPNQRLSKELHPLHLTPRDKADLLAFLKALTGEVRGRERPAFP